MKFVFFIFLFLFGLSSFVSAVVTTGFEFTTETDVYAKEARYCDRTSLNLNSLFNPLTSCDTTYDKTSDSSLDASDDSRETTETINGDGSDEGLYWIFWFNTSSIENSTISNILWSYEGYFSGINDVDPDFYYWNVATETWVEFSNSPLTSSDSFVYFDATSEGVNPNVLVNRTGFTYFALIDTQDSDGIAYLYTDYSDFNITFDAAVDPTYTNLANNASNAAKNDIVEFSVDLSDDLLDYYVFAHNQTGTMTNQTLTDISGSSYSASYDLTVSLIKDSNICGMFWFNDSDGNQNFTTETCFTTVNSLPTLKTDISFINASIGHHFNATATFTDLDGGIDITNYTIKLTSGSCSTIGNTTSGDDVIIEYNCTGTALTSSYVQINATNGIGSVSSSNLTNTYPNQIPVVNGIAINDSSPAVGDNLNCSFTSLSDVDGDNVVVIEYDWIKDSVSQNINNSWLHSDNTTVGDNWQCSVISFDGYENSSKETSASISIGTGFVSPIINFTNATTAKTGINSSSLNPTNNNSWVNFTTTFYDENSDELHTLWICSTDSASASGCTATTYCNSSINSTGTTLSCKYDVSGVTGTSFTYYSFISDNVSLLSSSLSNTFEVNHPPDVPTIITPVGNTTLDYVLINYTNLTLDPDGDIENYTIYNSSDGITYSVLNSNTTVFNWTSLADGTYYLKAYSFDEHGYYLSLNSSVTSFTVDTTNPIVQSNRTNPTSVERDNTIDIFINTSDTTSSIDSVIIEVENPNSVKTNSSANFSKGLNNPGNYSEWDITFTTSIVGLHDVIFYILDSNGNTAIFSDLTFSVSAPSAVVVTPPGGGGGSTTTIVKAAPTDVENITGLCGNGICEEGETPWSCPQDCFEKIFEFDQIFCLPLFACGNWEKSWFINIIIIVVIGSIGYWWFKKQNPNFKLFKPKSRRKRNGIRY